ncbi:MAG: hypothetical protein AAF591_19905 [Verrucomicrobiota bacterium]
MAHPIDQAISSWNKLLADDPIAQSHDALTHELQKAGLLPDDRALCKVLRPRFVTASRHREEQLLARGLVSIHEKMLAGIESGDIPDTNLGGLREWIRRVRALDPRPESSKAAWLRLDASLARTQLHALELNGDAPSGEGHNDAVIAFLMAIPATERFLQQNGGTFLELLPGFERQIVKRAREITGVENPSVAWACWNDTPDRRKLVAALTSHLTSRGFPVVYADPSEFEVNDSATRLNGTRIHVILRACLTPELLERQEAASALIQAARSNHTVVLNPLGTEPLGHKALFAAISDPALTRQLSSSERKLIARHIPWTRLLVEQNTASPQGKEIDLLPWVIENRSHLVVKPMDGHSGEGVVLGWHTEPDRWEETVQTNLGRSVVQSRVRLHSERYPVIDDGLAEHEFYEDTDPFLFEGEPAGVLTRLSASEITNVSAGGGVAATLVLPDS